MAGQASALDKLAQGLRDALGEDLVSLVLFGSRARGTATERSDTNLLLVLRAASPAVLRRAAPALNAWTRGGARPPLVYTEAEWAGAADVFPLEVEDLREAHQVLAGRDVTMGPATGRGHQRHELEREARGMLLRLRAAWAACAPDGAALGALLSDATGTVAVLLRGVVRLAGRPVPSDPATLVAEAASLAGFAPAAFDWPLAARAGRPPRRLDAFDPVADAYLAAVEKLVAYVDSMEDSNIGPDTSRR